MQNYSLLKKLSHVSKPVPLKRGMSATIEEFLRAARIDAAADLVIGYARLAQ